MEIEERVRAFIVAELHWTGPAATLTSDYPLIDRGVVDSLGVLELGAFVAQTFRIKVNEADLLFENFRSLSAIARYVRDEVAKQRQDVEACHPAAKAVDEPQVGGMES